MSLNGAKINVKINVVKVNQMVDLLVGTQLVDLIVEEVDSTTFQKVELVV